MYTTLQLVDLIKKTNDNCSDYRVAKLLKITTQSVSKWRNGKNRMSEEAARKAAELLGLDEKYVVACIHAETLSETDMYPTWVKICHELAPKVAA